MRELENVIERALALSQSPTLTVRRPARRSSPTDAPRPPLRAIAANGAGRVASLSAAVDQLEHTLIMDALTQADHNQTRAAEILGTTRRILKYKMDKLGIVGHDPSEAG